MSSKTLVSANGIHLSRNGHGRPVVDARHACFKLLVKPSKIHRWGIYAGERIPARRKVIEYTGQRISRRETKRRADEREFNYLFTLDPYWCIDGAVGGSGAEFINHSCDPNCYASIQKGHILYMSARVIRPGEELTIDYRFDPHVERVSCACGSTVCRGTINLPR
jgi:SET domain-containing protein